MLKFTVSKPKIFTNLNKLANPKPIDYQIKEIKIVTIGDVLSSDESMIKDILSKELSKIPITMSDKISIPANAFDKTALVLWPFLIV